MNIDMRKDKTDACVTEIFTRSALRHAKGYQINDSLENDRPMTDCK
jgi:hypothetical protein